MEAQLQDTISILSDMPRITNMSYPDPQTGREVRFFHFMGPNNRGGLTIAYGRTLMGHSSGQIYRISTAVCNPSDSYCRRTGRYLAYDRFIGGECIEIPVPKTTKVTSLLSFLCNSMDRSYAKY
jgi:hypothetical protein